jgi:hypothetical protein
MAVGADAILAQLRSQRLRWVDLQAGAQPVRMQIDTPSQFKAGRIARALRSGDGDAAIAELGPLVQAWEGVTGALLLGAAVGSADPVPVHPGLFAVLVGDRPDWLSDLGMAALEQATAVARQAEADSGN